MRQLTTDYLNVDPQFLVSLLAREVGESDLAVFQAAYRAEGYLVADDFIEERYSLYLKSQEIPVQVANYCRNVLLGKTAYVGSTACYLLA